MQIITDFISQSYQDIVEEDFLSIKFPWYYTTNIDGKKVENTGFSHQFSDDESPYSRYYKLTLPILTEALNKIGKRYKDLYRIRAGMFIRNQNGVGALHSPHVDQDYEHLTLLYYVNDSDGPTNFWRTIDGKKQIIKQITPEKGKAVLFPFKTYHSSSCPVESPIRITLNYNFSCIK
tara:strand:+ start:312 stop:842 length:531 start_codon:yes stop_codon:yes gene_type:complete